MDELGMSLRRVRVRRSVAEKRRIVEQTLEPGASVARVARAHEVNPNVVFQWRREYRDGKLAEPGLVPVLVTCDQAVSDQPQGGAPATIRVDLPGGAVVSIEGSADPALVEGLRTTKYMVYVVGRGRIGYFALLWA